MVSNETAVFTLLSHPNLADILGDTDFNFDRFIFGNVLIPDSQNPKPLASKVDESLLSQLSPGYVY